MGEERHGTSADVKAVASGAPALPLGHSTLGEVSSIAKYNLLGTRTFSGIALHQVYVQIKINARINK